jgi:radical SAM superfamily enzyme YgiQ (UPF0313 family)
LAAAGLKRIHVGLESGDDAILAQVRKGSDSRTQIAAGLMMRQVGMELNSYVILGLGGLVRSESHARETARVINEMLPQVVRLRTLVPKINTPLLADIQAGRFRLLSPHGVLRETMALVEAITVPVQITSDHYTNYVNAAGRLPDDKEVILKSLKKHLAQDESAFRPFFIGTQ